MSEILIGVPACRLGEQVRYVLRVEDGGSKRSLSAPRGEVRLPPPTSRAARPPTTQASARARQSDGADPGTKRASDA